MSRGGQNRLRTDYESEVEGPLVDQDNYCNLGYRTHHANPPHSLSKAPNSGRERERANKQTLSSCLENNYTTSILHRWDKTPSLYKSRLGH